MYYIQPALIDLRSFSRAASMSLISVLTHCLEVALQKARLIQGYECRSATHRPSGQGVRVCVCVIWIGARSVRAREAVIFSIKFIEWLDWSSECKTR